MREKASSRSLASRCFAENVYLYQPKSLRNGLAALLALRLPARERAPKEAEAFMCVRRVEAGVNCLI